MKVTAILKKAVFIWGIASLGLALFFGAWIIINVCWNRAKHSAKDETMSRTFGPVELKVLRHYGKERADLFVTLADSGKVLLDGYQLPLSDYGLKYADVDSASIHSIAADTARIILFVRHDDCDDGTQYLWFLRRTGAGVTVVKAIELHDLRAAEPGKDVYWGSRNFTPEYVPDMLYASFSLPVEVRVDDKILVAPLLNARGLALLQQAYEPEMAKRISIVEKGSDTIKLQKLKTDLALFRELAAGAAYGF